MNWLQAGTIREITIAATAGNATISKTPGTGFRWFPLRCIISCVCDATVADRKILVNWQSSGSNNESSTIAGPTITANNTGYLAFNPVNYATGGSVLSVGLGLNFLQSMLENGEKLLFSVSNGVAGDSFSGRLIVLEVPIG